MSDLASALEPSSAIDEATLQALMAWRGRTETIEETIAPMPSAALAALLDDDVSPRQGDPIAPLAHWLHFLPIHRQSEIAEDGHVMRGGFMPPVPLPRRMFAGASVTFLKPLHIGERARRVGTVGDIVLKHGRTGPLVFVTVDQEIHGEDGISLRETQNIVYRSAPTGPTAPAAEIASRAAGDWSREFMPDSAALFRYSALLFNAHRIHYDYPYTTGVESYPGLVVHGQLVATLLADLARKKGRDLATFSFQSRSAFFADALVTARGKNLQDRVELWAEDPAGAVGMRAEASFQPF